jgi:hypothetical protein
MALVYTKGMHMHLPEITITEIGETIIGTWVVLSLLLAALVARGSRQR